MKTLVSVYAAYSMDYDLKPIFGNQSSFDKVCDWINLLTIEKKCGQVDSVVIFTDLKRKAQIEQATKDLSVSVNVISKDDWKSNSFLCELAACSKEYDTVIHCRSGCPFYDPKLTADLYKLHKESAAEYTFADGWPEGLAPCIVNSGTISILASLSANAEPQKITSEIFFDAMKKDINSFEIETLMAKEDMRQYRFDFCCDSKAKTQLCKNLFQLVGGTGASDDAFSANEISAKAVFSSLTLRTLPTFYNVQISAWCPGTCSYCPYPKAYENLYGHNPVQAKQLNPNCFMPKEKFANIVENMASFSGEAVVALSLWGEPLSHPDFLDCVAKVLEYSGLSVLVETDGTLVTEDLCKKLLACSEKASERRNGYPKIMWIISTDAVDQEMYSKMRGAGTPESPISFPQANGAVDMLLRYFPGNVYAQFVRTQTNECQLEAFYRKYKDSDAMIIQKYDSFAGYMPDLSVTDLSPIIRNPCWHQRRDMAILVDGSVPFCREFLLEETFGNVFSQSLEELWNLGKSMEYTEKCRNCDEYYTFNF